MNFMSVEFSLNHDLVNLNRRSRARKNASDLEKELDWL